MRTRMGDFPGSNAIEIDGACAAECIHVISS